MKEDIFYLEIPEKHNIFFHVHIPEAPNNKMIVFLNPVFDEKKRVQQFQAQTARALCNHNFHVIRFDYYGTGDSFGELFQLNLAQSVQDAEYICNYFKEKFKITAVNLLGIRMGADMAVKVAQNIDYIDQLIMAEPVVDGKHYITEQRTRRKAFYKFNNINPENEFITINGKTYEDHQGYPISEENLQFLEEHDLTKNIIKANKINLIKLDFLFSKRRISKLKEHIETKSILDYNEVKCPDFWASLEEIDTSVLTDFLSQRI